MGKTHKREFKKMKRKSPVRHKVRSHTREGRQVNSFMRGHGSNQNKFVKKRVVKKSKQKNPTTYTGENVRNLIDTFEGQEIEVTIKGYGTSEAIVDKVYRGTDDYEYIMLNTQKWGLITPPLEDVVKFSTIPSVKNSSGYKVIYRDENYKKHTEHMTKREVDEFYQKVRRNGLTVISVKKINNSEPESLATEEETYDSYSRRRRQYFGR
jgi:hypothetical protein